MRKTHRLVAVTAILAGLAVAGCGKASEFDNEAASDEGPSKVEPVKGSDVPRVVLTPQAARRIGIRTSVVRTAASHGHGKAEVVPYAAIIYDAQGNAFAYTTTRRLTFVRTPIRVQRAVGPFAVLSKGPPPGTSVVTVGAQELLGVEYGVEED
jgi:hypothetical protein